MGLYLSKRLVNLLSSDGYYVAFKSIILIKMILIQCHSRMIVVMKFMNIDND